jgi:hypothetical protein
MKAVKMDKLKTMILPNEIEIPIPTIEKVVRIANNKKMICSFFKAIPPSISVQGFSRK